MRKKCKKFWIIAAMCLLGVLFSAPWTALGADDIICDGTLMCDDFEYSLGPLLKSDVMPNWVNNNNVIQDATCPFSNETPTATDITVVDNPVRSGNAAIRMDLDACNSCKRSGKWRTEIKSTNGHLKYGSTYWVAFSMWMPGSFINDGKSEIIMQIHSSGHKFNIHTSGNRLVTNVYKPGGGFNTRTHSRGKVFEKWMDFKIHFKLHENDGFVRIFRKDEGESTYTQVVDYSGAVGNSTADAYLKLGIYKWSWGTDFQSGNSPDCGATTGSGVTHRTLYFDAVKITTIDPELIISSIDSEEINMAMPAKYALHVNYPNPFNPTTTIGYDLPEPQQVMISLYDNNGREIETLVDTYQPAGHYTIQVDGSHLASGNYFYKLTTDHHSEMKKMVLVK